MLKRLASPMRAYALYSCISVLAYSYPLAHKQAQARYTARPCNNFFLSRPFSVVVSTTCAHFQKRKTPQDTKWTEWLAFAGAKGGVVVLKTRSIDRLTTILLYGLWTTST
jgi:hypothetical protein